MKKKELVVPYKEKLENEGYRITQINNDKIKAIRDNHEYTFEIHVTDAKKNYFGGTTITSWKDSLKNEFYYYVMIWSDGTICKFRPLEFVEYCDIPPFKITFHIDSNGMPTRPKHSVYATEDKIIQLIEYYKDLRID